MTPEPLDFQLPEESQQEEEQQQDTDTTDPASYTPEPGKPRCMPPYLEFIFLTCLGLVFDCALGLLGVDVTP